MEKIICAAIHYDDGRVYIHQPRNIKTGYVVCGRRHHNCIGLHMILTGKATGNETQGFLTSLDRFLDRVESIEVAAQAGQIELEKVHGQLFSEDLY